MNVKEKLLIGACIGDCIHVAGILNFMQLASRVGFKTLFLGPACKIDTIIDNIIRYRPEVVALSYRLTPENGIKCIDSFLSALSSQFSILNYQPKLLFGGLPELSKKVKELGAFYHTFSGGETFEETISIIRRIVENKPSSSFEEDEKIFSDNLLERIKQKSPYPIIRVHFGLPDFNETINGVSKIAESCVVDVISIAPDQVAQEYLQRPQQLMDAPKGSGGVPIRSKEDLDRIYKISRRGNFPLLRIYSGTQDLIKNAEMFQESIKNAWAAIPIFWYSQLDGRGPCSLKDAIQEHLEAIKWHAKRNIPVEINDPHQWGLRLAPDHLVVADAYLSAMVAKELGVRNFIQQLMFNTPAGTSWKMDIARIFAMIEITRELIDDSFNIIRETRAGLSYLSSNQNVAKGQLAASTLLQMYVQPQIMHVVSYCEGDHAAKPEDIIESCEIVRNIVLESLMGAPSIEADSEILKRKEELIEEAKLLINFIENLADSKNIRNPYSNAEFLAFLVESGLFDAPQLVGSKIAKGKLKTAIIEGKCVMINEDNEILSESCRLSTHFNFFSNANVQFLCDDELMKSEGNYL